MANSHNPESEYVWISPTDPMPNVCSDCGMYTDHRVRVKHVAIVQEVGLENEGCAMILVTIIIHIAFGPVGWLISAFMRSPEDKNGGKTVKKKTKIKLSRCRLCHGMNQPKVIDSLHSPMRLMFKVHPRFRSSLEESRATIREKNLADRINTGVRP